MTRQSRVDATQVVAPTAQIYCCQTDYLSLVPASLLLVFLGASPGKRHADAERETEMKGTDWPRRKLEASGACDAR